MPKRFASALRRRSASARSSLISSAMLAERAMDFGSRPAARQRASRMAPLRASVSGPPQTFQ